MPNQRPPSRVPRRGLTAFVLTIAAVALLFSFRTPTELFSDGTATAFAADLPPTTAVALSSSNVAGSGSNTPVGIESPATPPTKEPPTMPPATEPPPTKEPPTMPPATEPPATEPPPEVPEEQVITGQTVRTRYGLVQVEVTLSSDGISDVQALQLPFDRSYSARISRYVAPILREEALRAQHSGIDLISGATYTSTAYAMSLQSALDQAPEFRPGA